MGRRQLDAEVGRRALLLLLITGAISCFMVYLSYAVLWRPSSESGSNREKSDEGPSIWSFGEMLSSGDLISSRECCMACKGMCGGSDGPCFVGDKQACGTQFGEVNGSLFKCWLKKQKDVLEPDQRDSGDQGIIELEKVYGMLHVKRLPDCAPRSVSYILELLRLRHCGGCQFYRAEGRGSIWDLHGNHIREGSYGPPFALVQGTLNAHGVLFKDIEMEACPSKRRGYISSGPDFIISLANHHKWTRSHTVFGFVLAEDMAIVEKISNLPTKPEVRTNIRVQVLEEALPFDFRLTGSVS